MNNIELAEANVIIDITKYYSKKIIVNFRNDKWRGKIKSKVEESVRRFGGAIIAETTSRLENSLQNNISKEYNNKLIEATKEIRFEVIKELEKKYEKYIPIPTSTFKTRIKFLFTGRLV